MLQPSAPQASTHVAHVWRSSGHHCIDYLIDLKWFGKTVQNNHSSQEQPLFHLRHLVDPRARPYEMGCCHTLRSVKVCTAEFITYVSLVMARAIVMILVPNCSLGPNQRHQLETCQQMRTPTALRMSVSPIPGPPGSLSTHTLSSTRWSSCILLQCGFGSDFSHLKSSTWSHIL
jgi:hypothetical protein